MHTNVRSTSIEAEGRAELAEARADEAEKKLEWAMQIMQGKAA